MLLTVGVAELLASALLDGEDEEDVSSDGGITVAEAALVEVVLVADVVEVVADVVDAAGGGCQLILKATGCWGWVSVLNTIAYTVNPSQHGCVMPSIATLTSWLGPTLVPLWLG